MEASGTGDSSRMLAWRGAARDSSLEGDTKSSGIVSSGIVVVDQRVNLNATTTWQEMREWRAWVVVEDAG
jgi:hypothetical protein